MKRIDIVFLVLSILLIGYYLLAMLSHSFATAFVLVYEWLLDVASVMGYGGSLMVSFMGNATILFPIPYLVVPFIQGGLKDAFTDAFVFNPWLLGLAAGLGAQLGEMTGYMIGYFSRNLIDQDKQKAFSNLITAHPRLTPVLVWFLAVTPLPDDMLVVPLGTAKYSWWKVVVPGFIGKSMFLAGIAWAGRLGLEWVSELVFQNSSPSLVSQLVELVGVFLVLVALYIIARFDWSSIMEKKFLGLAETES
ncbi:MAG: VTT domain-containing protein [Candidatus Thorarchaeota archaeon]|nr:VTT domain-containing protein [Candidatus Thorarchaeota archaeon]